jgi:hypothetical protein
VGSGCTSHPVNYLLHVARFVGDRRLLAVVAHLATRSAFLTAARVAVAVVAAGYALACISTLEFSVSYLLVPLILSKLFRL